MNELKTQGRNGVEASRHVRKYLKELIFEQSELHHQLRADRKERRKFRQHGLGEAKGMLLLALALLVGSVGFFLTYGEITYLLPAGVLFVLSGVRYLYEWNQRRKAVALLQSRRTDARRAAEIAVVCAVALRKWLGRASTLQRGRFFSAIYDARRRFRSSAGSNGTALFKLFVAMLWEVQECTDALAEYQEELVWLKRHPVGWSAVSLKQLFETLDKLLC